MNCHWLDFCLGLLLFLISHDLWPILRTNWLIIHPSDISSLLHINLARQIRLDAKRREMVRKKFWFDFPSDSLTLSHFPPLGKMQTLAKYPHLIPLPVLQTSEPARTSQCLRKQQQQVSLAAGSLWPLPTTPATNASQHATSSRPNLRSTTSGRRPGTS